MAVDKHDLRLDAGRWVGHLPDCSRPARHNYSLCHSNPMTDEQHQLRNTWVSPFDTKLGLEVTFVSAQRVIGRAPVAGNTQPFGLWHGGATAAIMETLGSLGANAHAGPGRRAVGTELNVSHLRSTTQGWVHAQASAVHLGRTSAVYQIDVRDDEGQLLASGRLSCRLLD